MVGFAACAEAVIAKTVAQSETTVVIATIRDRMGGSDI
jgi:hypothetical protein